MAGRLATVPEESADGSAATYPRSSLYRDWIRTVAMSGLQIRSAHPTLFSHSQSSHYGSSYSSDSGTASYPSNSSGSPSISASAAAADFGHHELRKIASKMMWDGYIQRMVQAFNNSSPEENGVHQNRVLQSWFFELDVDWVLQIRQEHGSQWQIWLKDNSGSSLQDLVERWIRGLTVIVIVLSTIDLLGYWERNSSFPQYHELPGIARFGKASITEMLAFVDAIVPVLKAEKLQAMLYMYICVCTLRGDTTPLIALNGIADLLWSEEKKLFEAISCTMEDVRTHVDDDDGLWAIEIKHGQGEVHKKIRLMGNSIVCMKKAVVLIDPFAPPRPVKNKSDLEGLMNDMIDYLKDLLLRKSELCSDPSLRYLFLLNNSYFVEKLCEPWRFPMWYERDKILTPECKKYLDSYLDVSWGHVLSCIPKSRFPGPIHRWINTSSLAKFESRFRKTYQAQKLWKVPDRLLRNELQRAIATRVISAYRGYLEEHPELAKYVGHESSSPEVLEEMLVELFEG